MDRESAVVREGLMWIVSERGVNVDRESAVVREGLMWI